MRTLAAVSTALVLAALGCGGGGGGSPSCTGAQDITGVWNGTATNDSVARGGTGSIDATITQTGCDLGGTWRFVFSDPHLDRDLRVAGSPPRGTDVQFLIGDTVTTCDVFGNCVVGTCLYDVRGTLVDPNEIVGTYATNETCSQSRSGSFDIRRTAVLVSPAATSVPVPTP